MTIQEDIDFLQSMATDRKATIAGLDKIEEGKRKRKSERVIEDEKRKEREEDREEKAEREAQLTINFEDDPVGDLTVAETPSPPPVSKNKENWYNLFHKT